MSEAGTIDRVLWYIDNYREELLSQIFPNAVREYKEERYKLTQFQFWFSLDDGNKAKTIEFAKEFYSEEVQG